MKPLVAGFLLLATLGCGEGGQVQPETADALRARAEQGDAEAQVSLGVKYSNGDGVPEDDAEAARRYRLAADQGLAEAVRLLRLAAEQGHADAAIGVIW
jgi:TPR repeat protein